MKPIGYNRSLLKAESQPMSKAIKLSETLIHEAAIYAKAQHRSTPKQIEHWARMGKIAEENPDMPYSFIQGLLIAVEEVKAGEVSEYEFG